MVAATHAALAVPALGLTGVGQVAFSVVIGQDVHLSVGDLGGQVAQFQVLWREDDKESPVGCPKAQTWHPFEVIRFGVDLIQYPASAPDPVHVERGELVHVGWIFQCYLCHLNQYLLSLVL